MKQYGSGTAAIEALPMIAGRGGGSAPRIQTIAAAEDELEQASALGVRYIFWDDPDYPPLLTQIDVPPPLLLMRGRAEMMQQPCVAIVGARNASAAACRFARQLAMELSEAGVTIISGLARGVDTAAHIGAIQGQTAAVIASGHDIAFPQENEALQQKIAEDHLLISEFPIGTEPLARQFPARNRIIAGAALATLIVEAAPKSGSLITARQAAEFGRDVLAVPGSPLDPRARGCNQLIQDGAILIQSAEDVLNFIRPIDKRMEFGSVSRSGTPLFQFDQGQESDVASDFSDDAVAEPEEAVEIGAAIVNLMGSAAVSIDELIRQSGADVAAVQNILLELELAGKLERHAGAKVSLLS